MSFVFSFSKFTADFICDKEMKMRDKERANTNDTMEKKAAAFQDTYDKLVQTMTKDKRRQEITDQKLVKLQAQHNALIDDMEVSYI